MGHSCTKPYKPLQIDGANDLADFQSEVAQYQQCINDFIEEQNDGIKSHQEAAQEAIDDWKNFVNFELN